MPLLSPIPVGFVLDNRYEVSQFLGYGGFGRTYLARDRQRFNELSVLKEFAPQISSPEILRKAAELFQREAGTLYQLRHAQIPEFRAILQAHVEGHDVLLIIEQYIAGQTYEQWADDGNRLDEPGAIQFLQDILPVLSYVHDRGIIHRDIAPDNLIREATTGKPFLIDFGSVKQLATEALQLSGSLAAGLAGTQIHKPGFSPPEQLRGEVTPSTDLYSLAVTTLVLLTGRTPNELYDNQMATWRWREILSLSPGFGNFLDRLLAYQPNQRPASATAAQQLLQSIAGISGFAPGDLAPYIPSPPIVHTPKLQAPIAPVSQMRTIAVAPADSRFPTTYPEPARSHDRIESRRARRQDPRLVDPRLPEQQLQNRSTGNDYPDRDQPQEDLIISLIKLPWKLLVWCLKGLWMGIKAIDMVLTWVWRGLLMLALVAGAATATYLWSARPQMPPSQSRSIPDPATESPSLEFPSLPKIKLPEIQLPTLPEIKLPELKLPDWTSAKTASCSEMIHRSEDFGLTQSQLYKKVNSRFRAKHPELNDRTLTDRPEDAQLRQEWCNIAEQVLAETAKP